MFTSPSDSSWVYLNICIWTEANNLIVQSNSADCPSAYTLYAAYRPITLIHSSSFGWTEGAAQTTNTGSSLNPIRVCCTSSVFRTMEACSGVHSHTATFCFASSKWSSARCVAVSCQTFDQASQIEGRGSPILSSKTVFEQKHWRSFHYLHLQHIRHVSTPCFSSKMSCKSAYI